MMLKQNETDEDDIFLHFDVQTLSESNYCESKSIEVNSGGPNQIIDIEQMIIYCTRKLLRIYSWIIN